ncbi:hypothetical protein [Parapedobacter sp. 10938]|uniref:hypothetical protein n=1 Tax=Parapedobacter flavus TaxID=3110225 RepID=UPI002DBABF22|nr:hypothetical protein [Parapedobacter sp. 10938]MEC3881243.1 hypothetical protein [Parapedobacter sp. 10938]
MKVREVIAFRNYFEDFLNGQPQKVQDKIFKIIEAIETLERVPSNYLKAMTEQMAYTRHGYNWAQTFGGSSVSLMVTDW